MCGRYGLFASNRQLEDNFRLDDVFKFEKRYNISPGMACPVVGENPVENRRTVAKLEWGITPSWRAGSNSPGRLINARSENLIERPTFRKLLQRKRCIIPASGFYEWKQENNNKRPYWIYSEETDLIALAGLWTGRSFVIITTGASEKIKHIHHRMPAMIEPADYDSWLEPENENLKFSAGLLKELPGDELDFHPVSRKVNDPGREKPDCVEPV